MHKINCIGNKERRTKMPTLEYSKSPNVDTAFAVQDDGTKNRVVLTAPQDTSTLELPSNPNSTKGYVTIDGKKHRVILTAEVGGGSSSGGVTSVNGMTGDVTLGINDVAPQQSGFSGYVLGTDGSVAGWVKPEIIQRSAMPQASEEEEGKIYQFVGTTDSNYTNGYFYKCVANYSEASATVAQTAGNSLSDLAVDVDTLEAYLSPTGDLTRLFRFYDSFNGQTNVWTCVNNSQIVNLADFGISYTGTPVDQDAISLVYTAGTTTYSWERIDVQPEGAKGIEWAATVDLPANSNLDWNAFPVYTVAGGLPDGEYEFTWQINCGSYSSYPIGVVTYNARIKVDTSENNYIVGTFEPVIDGEWIPSPNYIPSEQYVSQVFKNKDGDIIIYTDASCWRTDIAASLPSVAVSKCFKITKIKNIATGVEYDITGALFDPNNPPSYDFVYDGSMDMRPLAQPQTIPMYYMNNYNSFDDNTQYIYISTYNVIANNDSASCAELDFSARTSNGGKYHVIVENSTNSYVARVIEASGDLENTQIGMADGYAYIYLNTTAGTTGTVYYSLGIKGGQSAANAYVNAPSGAFVPLSLHNVGATVDMNNLGAIEQYKGTTTASYTHGYFYEATGTIVSTPATYVIDQTTPNDVTITCTDAEGLVNAIATRTTWPQSYVKDLLTTNNTLSLTYDFDNSTILDMNIDGIGVLDSSEYAYFTVSGSYAGTMTIYASSTTFTDAGTEVQNGAWVQVNTQPGATTPSTMPTLTVAGWSSNTQTVTVNGVTTTNNVLVAPTPASAADWTSAGVICTAQGTDSLTFTCQTTPSNDITVNVCILG